MYPNHIWSPPKICAYAFDFDYDSHIFFQIEYLRRVNYGVMLIIYLAQSQRKKKWNSWRIFEGAVAVHKNGE